MRQMLLTEEEAAYIVWYRTLSDDERAAERTRQEALYDDAKLALRNLIEGIVKPWKS